MADNEQANNTPTGSSGHDIFQDLKTTNLGQISSILINSWEKHKIYASIVYSFVLFLLGIIGYGGITYYQVQNDAKSFREIWPEYQKLRGQVTDLYKEKTDLDKEKANLTQQVFALGSQNINYESALALTSAIENHLATASHAIASLVFGDVDIHDPQTSRSDDKTAWIALGAFSDFLIQLEKLLSKIAPDKNSSRDVLTVESAVYAALRGKYYEATQEENRVKSAAAKKALLDYTKYYHDKFPDYRHYSEYMMGLYYTIQSMPNIEKAMEHFDKSINITPKGEIWPAPYYQKILLYERLDDLDGFIAQCIVLKDQFEKIYKTRRHQFYFLTIISLVEGSIAKYGLDSTSTEAAFKEFNKIWRAIEKEQGYHLAKDYSKQMKIIEAITTEIIAFERAGVIDFDRILNDDIYKDYKDGYYTEFIKMLTQYIDAAKFATQNDIHQSREILTKLADEDVDLQKITGPKFLIKWIKEKASDRLKSPAYNNVARRNKPST